MAKTKENTKGIAEPKKVDKKKSKKVKAKVAAGLAHINASFNNTIVTLSDEQGNVLVSFSPAKVGFKNSKKRTAYAATKAAVAAGSAAVEKYSLKDVKVYVKGAGVGRNAAIKGLSSAGLNITMLADITRTPHNGCRPPRKPRK